MISKKVFGRFSGNSRERNRALVMAVVGMEANVGTTHTCVMLAHALAKERYRVAVVECNRSGDFERIEKAYEGEGFDASRTTCFKVKQVNYFKDVRGGELTDLYQEAFDYVILDIGHDFDSYRQEIVRADIPLFVGYCGDWKRVPLMEFVRNWAEVMTLRSKLLLRNSTKEDLRELRRTIRHSCCLLPEQRDPFVRDKAHGALMKKIVGVE